jgi:putative flavoprotein involved in K+ transport
MDAIGKVPMRAQFDCVVVGAGPAGLATSGALADRGVDHVVLERDQVGQSWRSQRWDSFRLNTPGWCNEMLGSFGRNEFATAPEVVARLDALAAALPVRQRTPVTSLERTGADYVLGTPDGELRGSRSHETHGSASAAPRLRELRARTVVLATGDQNVPRVPAVAERMPPHVRQMHAAEYCNAADLPDGAVLVVGSAQSGCQIAEDLVTAGRRVYLATSRVSRLPWRHRGRDTIEWLVDAGFFDQRPQDLENPAMVRAAQPIVASGGRSLSLQLLARAGVTLLGRIVDIDGRTVAFDDSAAANAAFGDQSAGQIRTMIDTLITGKGIDAAPAEPDDAGGQLDGEAVTTLDLAAAGVSTIVWCTGFTGDFSWVRLPVIDDTGRPVHGGGATTAPGLWFVGLTWLSKRKSGVLLGFPEDAGRIADQVTAHLATAGSRAG